MFYLKMAIIALLLLPLSMFAQTWPLNPNDHYIILKASIDSVDITDEVIEVGAFIKFYPVGRGVDSFFMANIWPKTHTQSYGLISDISYVDDFYKGDKINVMEFTWHYRNTYDMVSGKADIRLLKIHYDEYLEFAIFITPETNEEFFYTGIVEKQ